MKRILFLSFYFRPDLCAGSFRNSPLLEELSRKTRDKNIRIDVFTTQPNRYASFNRDAPQVYEFDNVRIERINIPPHEGGIIDQAFSFRTFFFKTLQKTKNKRYDLVYGSSSRFFTSYLAYRIAKKNKCPLYLDVRDIFSETLSGVSKNPFTKYLIIPVIRTLENRVYNHSRHINLISKGFESSFNRYKKKTFSYFTHGIDPIFLVKATLTIPKKKSSKKTILYAGNIGEGQGLHKIIPTTAKLLETTHQFEIIGEGGAMDKLMKSLKDLDVQNVNLRKPVERKDLVNEYHTADYLFLHLNNYEIFKKVLPSKIFELASTDKPILAGVDGFAAEFLRLHVPNSYVFKPGDYLHLLSLIDKIGTIKSSDPERLQNFKQEFNLRKINSEMAASILHYL